MSATYTAASEKLKKMEGGYCAGGMACGSAGSGETYRGIDRRQWPAWQGWQMFDAYKRLQGQPKYNTFLQGAAAAPIEKEVNIFWSGWWNKYGFNLIVNQNFAAMLYAFSAQGQNRAMREINSIATTLGATATDSGKITPAVAAVLNANAPRAYDMLRTVIINFYKKAQPQKAATFIAQRVSVFPATIPATPAKIIYSAPGKTTPATTGNKLLSWLSALFSLSSLMKK